MAQLKIRNGLKIAVVSNESQEVKHFDSKVQAGRVVDFFILRASSIFASLTQTFSGLRWTSPRRRSSRWYISTIPQCSSRSRRLGGSKYSSYGVRVHVRELASFGLEMTKEFSRNRLTHAFCRSTAAGEHQVCIVRSRASLQRILEGGIERIGLPEAALRVKGLTPADNFSRLVQAPNHYRRVLSITSISRVQLLALCD